MDLREIQVDYETVRPEKLVVGALLEARLGENDGITLKGSRTTRLKKIVVIGFDKIQQCCYGSVLINTKMNPAASYSDEFLSAQYQIKQIDYPHFLRYDSYVDCAEIFSFPISLLSRGKYCGCLTKEDIAGIFEILETTETLSTKLKKRFGIRRR